MRKKFLIHELGYEKAPPAFTTQSQSVMNADLQAEVEKRKLMLEKTELDNKMLAVKEKKKKETSDRYKARCKIT